MVIGAGFWVSEISSSFYVWNISTFFNFQQKSKLKYSRGRAHRARFCLWPTWYVHRSQEDAGKTVLAQFRNSANPETDTHFGHGIVACHCQYECRTFGRLPSCRGTTHVQKKWTEHWQENRKSALCWRDYAYGLKTNAEQNILRVPSVCDGIGTRVETFLMIWRRHLYMSILSCYLLWML